MDLTTSNDITGDRLATKPATEAYKEGIERIFGKKERKQWVPPPLPVSAFPELQEALKEGLDDGTLTPE
jgi:hypothetical protein